MLHVTLMFFAIINITCSEYNIRYVNVNVIDFARPVAPSPKGAAICNMTPTQGNRDAFSACLKQSNVLVIQVARVAAGNWFQSCGPDTANARRPYLSVATRGTHAEVAVGG